MMTFQGGFRTGFNTVYPGVSIFSLKAYIIRDTSFLHRLLYFAQLSSSTHYSVSTVEKLFY